MAVLTTVNPATGKPLAEYPVLSDVEVDLSLDRAAAAQVGWAALGESATGPRCCVAPPRSFEKSVDPLARLVTREMGKPLAQARAEVEKCAGVRLLRRARRRLPRRRAHGHRGRPQLDRLRAARRGARGHAVELPVLAGVPVRRARR